MQLTLPLTEPPRSIQERFSEFHAKNQQVFELFRRYARQVKAAGHKRYSADAILHRIRWHMNVEVERDGEFKLNDHFSSRYARLLIEVEPEFDGFFEIRKLKAG